MTEKNHEFGYIVNRSSFDQIYKGYRMHDNLYFSRGTALLFDDGKDRIEEVYYLIKVGEMIHEGEQLENYFYGSTEQEVRERFLTEE